MWGKTELTFMSYKTPNIKVKTNAFGKNHKHTCKKLSPTLVNQVQKYVKIVIHHDQVKSVTR